MFACGEISSYDTNTWAGLVIHDLDDVKRQDFKEIDQINNLNVDKVRSTHLGTGLQIHLPTLSLLDALEPRLLLLQS